MIVLASSTKVGGRCIAGISTSSGEWLRPVSDQGEGELYPFHCRVDGRIPQPLDIVRFGYRRALDDPTQPENVLVDEQPWRLTGKLDSDGAYSELEPFLVSGPALFGNGDRSLTPTDAQAGLSESLALIEPADLHFEVRRPWAPGGPSRPRALFSLGGWSYDLPVTDPIVRARLAGAGFGAQEQAAVGLSSDRRTLATISLGGENRGAHWKLAAAFLSIA